MIHLVTHVQPDGDALGAVFAVRELLASAGQESIVHLWGDLPRWFPVVHKLLGSPPYTTEPVTEGAVWLLDASALSRCGEGNVADGVTVDVLIDHHPDEGTEAAFWRSIHPECSSACEVLAARTPTPWLDDAKFNSHSAGWLYLGMRTDSLAFSTATTTKHTHNVAAWMIARGAPHLEIAAALHKSMTRQHLNFQSWVISNAVPVGDALVLTADRRSRLRFGVGTNDAKIAFGPTSQLLDVNLVALLIERDDGQTFLSFRSPGSDRAQALARRFGGGGHPSAAGARVDRSLWDVQSELIALLSVAEVA